MAASSHSPSLPDLARAFNGARHPALAQLIVALVFTAEVIALDYITNRTEFMVTGFGGHVFGIPLTAIIGTLILGLVVAAMVFSLITLRNLAHCLQLPPSLLLLSTLAIVIPFTAPIAGLALLTAAARTLRRAGVSASLLHPVSRADLARLEGRWCGTCGYSRAGLPLGAPCPECGKV